MSINKNVAVFVGLALALAVVGMASPVSAAALTQAQVDAIIGLLQSFGADQSTISNVQASLTGGTPTGGTGGTVGSYVFNTNLTMGSKGVDVTNLQKVLNSDADTIVAASGVGSAGNESSYFGALTKAAVIKFQKKYGITPAVGYVGAITRAKLNTMGGVVVVTPPGTTPPVVPAGTGLTVSAAVQPAAQLAPLSAARIPMTKVTFTAGNDGDVVVNSLVAERGGPSVDADISGIVLLDETGAQLGLAKTLNSAHQVTLSEPFTVKAGQSRTMTLALNRPAADADSSSAGAVFSLSLVAVNTSATVTGSLPIVGTGQTGNVGLTIGSVTNARGPLDPNGSVTKEVGKTGYTFSSIKITAGSAEKIVLNSIRWNQSGSAASADFANLTTYVDGVAYPVVVSSDGKYYTSSFGGMVIDKGLSKEISIKGDIVGGSGRTIAFDLYRNTDLNVVGQTYGYGITPPTSGTGFASTNPWYDASVVTVSNGTLTVSKATSVAAQNIAINLADQPLGGFEVEVLGEPISVTSMIFNTSTTTADVVTNVSLVGPNGSVMAGPVDLVAGTPATLTFTDTVTFPIGKGVYSLRGKLSSTWGNSTVFSASTTPSTQWTGATGQVTGNSITTSPTTLVSANQMTAKTAVITISVSASPSAQTIVAGANGYLFANYQLDATASGEDIRFTSLPLEYNAGGNTVTNVKNCRLYDNNVDISGASNKVDPSAIASSTTFTIDGGLTVAKNTTKTLALKCDIGAGATGVYAWGYDSSASPSATGLTSGQSATITENDSMGQLMTLSAGGTFTVALDDSSTPSYALGAGGTAGNTFAVLKLHASNEAISLSKIGLQLTNTASSSPQDLTNIYVYDGATKLGEGQFTGTATTMTLTLTTPVTIPKNGDLTLTIKGDLGAVSEDGPMITSGRLIAIDYDGTTVANTQGTGSASGTTINTSSTADSASSGIRVMKSFPTIAKVTLPTYTLDNGTKSLLRFKVTADAKGPISIAKVTVRLSTTTATVTGLNVYAFTDSGYSTPVSGLGTAGEFRQTAFTGVVWSTSASNLEFYPQTSASATTTVQVPAGGSRYFEVQGTVSGAAAGASISTQLQGDPAYPAASSTTYMLPVDEIDGLYANRKYWATYDHVRDFFIWSPNSTTTPTVGTNDWTNGYGIVGLPGTNMSAEVISK